ncbi:MAG: phosphoribosylformylglycinamidine synthase subunit PurS [Paenibacillus sp.]|uniref:Phosphoribosylformylglycinamidine synthase subunit PurS n=1 Tax=Paenibacillus aquistagni TaxID=1852522 RepID=A0A1X7LMN2_9BACL|nr:phosphoribosylformylglycinamidine synthase subunit PurS [Paenibacillus aquistagni]MBR2567701.1 phosphoribosylformylglycinamidine synthase subunit PurS [Paenibacillus sp.]SMG55121.1 phosphoribosylformylglycinamidine synthase [Paenibacillus aquistagni]
MFKAKVYVTTKANVLDPQGAAVQRALHTMGYGAVEDVRIGKYLEFVLETNDRAQAEADLKKMCEQILSNPVVEDYRYELED